MNLERQKLFKYFTHPIGLNRVFHLSRLKGLLGAPTCKSQTWTKCHNGSFVSTWRLFCLSMQLDQSVASGTNSFSQFESRVWSNREWQTMWALPLHSLWIERHLPPCLMRQIVGLDSNGTPNSHQENNHPQLAGKTYNRVNEGMTKLSRIKLKSRRLPLGCKLTKKPSAAKITLSFK